MTTAEIEAQEEQVQLWRDQLEANKDEPGVADEIKKELAKEEEKLAALKSQHGQRTTQSPATIQTSATSQAPAESQPREKWSKENHPAFRDSYNNFTTAPEPGEAVPAPVTFKVNDMVLAKWVHGDKQFYKAKITLITGSSSSPLYRVKFVDYDDTDEVKGADIKPLSSASKKRKADGMSVSDTATPISSNNNNVIFAAANIDPDLASQARKEPSKVSDGPPKPPKMARKVKAKKELEKNMNNWKAFQQKGPKTSAVKKDSMFRTPEGVHGRVGFTGSGVPMRKDHMRGRHIYQPGLDDDR
ncbi:hypothetical protein K432DRAFT_378398 [Lepidopterella palustris CBS 459.81]|uniref:Tudor domain-containing protein n=1 Tax=Lepidopterella palustris CBS 459.81 TaxID=1314670 RepID=A0A8E2JJE1_9PEZI|nr:hypothetical protein K432DRAFT_378398 [Lepidopterella palustris CBS 459.81]